MTDGRLAASFRDPGGFLFRRDGVLYRQVNASCADDLRLLHDSGLYAALTGKGLLVPHAEAPRELGDDVAACVIAPREIPFVSHPYEWCFSQLKDAALATLRIQKLALRYGMTLKDASAYNIQFDRRPARAHRHPVLGGLRRGRAVGGLPPVLPAFPGAAGADGQGGRAAAVAAAHPHRRRAPGPGGAAAALARTAVARRC